MCDTASYCDLDLSGKGWQFGIEDGKTKQLVLRSSEAVLQSPIEGLWSVAMDWRDDWPAKWRHGQIESVKQVGPWLEFSGRIKTEKGDWILRDSCRSEGDRVRVIRRWTWTGKEALDKVTLSVRWQTPQLSSRLMLPGICYYGNPSGVKTGFGKVAKFSGKPGEELLFEEHRYPIPFASLEWGIAEKNYGAALHSLPSYAPFGNRRDQWWSLGVIASEKATEFTLLSGPIAMNGQRNFAKSNQKRLLRYGETWMKIPPGAVIEKTFWLQGYPVEKQGRGFLPPMRTAIDIWQPFDLSGMPTMSEILTAKYRYALSRWHESDHSAGFRMYPNKNEYVMGWAGQSEAPGYALLVLADKLDDPKAKNYGQRTLDFLSTAPVNQNGFPVRYDPKSKKWRGQDPVSQGQALEIFARAIAFGRKDASVDTSKWERFFQEACDAHAKRIWQDDWRPVSTNEGFLVSPLCRAWKLFKKDEYRQAAMKAAEHYAQRHLSMDEPYWGGTLDARCEDKEGAWAGFQAFLAVYELTGERASIWIGPNMRCGSR